MVKFYHNIVKSQSLNLFVLKNRKYSILYFKCIYFCVFCICIEILLRHCIVFLESFYTFVTMHCIRKHSRTNEIP